MSNVSKDTRWEAAKERGGPCSSDGLQSHPLAPRSRQPPKEMRWCPGSWEEMRTLDSEWSGIVGISQGTSTPKGCHSLAASMLTAMLFPELRGLHGKEGVLGVLWPSLDRPVSET